MKSFFLIFLLLVVLLAQGCAARNPPVDVNQQVRDLFLGKSIERVISVLGPPDREYSLGNGSRVYTFDFARMIAGQSQEKSYGRNSTTTQSLTCNVNLTVGRDGAVTEATAIGLHCAPW